MAKKEHKKPQNEEELQKEEQPVKAQPEQPEAQPTPDPLEDLQKKLDKEHDGYLRLAAEYDNFRKRSQKEREALYNDVRAQTVAKFLPVYDDLERAVNNETEDSAYKKGVEMTMKGLKKIMQDLGVEEFGEKGDAFDPNMHNAVMHVEDEAEGENVILEVFQRGFRLGEKVIRFAVVKVAN